MQVLIHALIICVWFFIFSGTHFHILLFLYLWLSKPIDDEKINTYRNQSFGTQSNPSKCH